ncbi:MAG: hypothetical protein DI531_09545 [Brevundimonas sp.]|jgi:hypothetical protein|nr:MAG: hypothetical protein DI531_09545 [Brevundimonas sp.]
MGKRATGRRRKRPFARPTQEARLQVESFGNPPEDHEAFKTAILEAATANVGAFHPDVATDGGR